MKSRSGSAGLYWYLLFTYGVGTSDIVVHFFQQTVKSRSGCQSVQAHNGYLLFSCGLGTSLTWTANFFSRQRSSDQVVWMHRLICIFAVLIWHRNISHVVAFFFPADSKLQIKVLRCAGSFAVLMWHRPNFSSPEQKLRVSYCDHPLSIVCHQELLC